MDQHCVIWGSDYPAEVEARTDDTVEVIGSARTTVPYLLTRDVADFWIGRLDPRQKAQLTTWLIDRTFPGEYPPLVNIEVVDRIKNGRSLSEGRRADRLLKHIADQTPVVGTQFSLNTITEGALAWSESVEESEIGFLIHDLMKKELLDAAEMQASRRYGTFKVPKNVRVTVDGYDHIRTQIVNAGASQAFVAMWLHKNMEKEFRKGIEPAIEDAGYRSIRIPEQEFTGLIEDKIIAEIRQSRFMVADLSHNKTQGVRGSVYYEAGFAHGIGLDIIFTCRKKSFGNVHFDLNHYNHIIYESVAELRERLTARIRAAIGQGPLRQEN